MPFYQAARARLDGLERAGAMFWISRQVLREFLAVTTRPGAVVPAPPLDSLLHAVRRFEAEFEVADEGAAVTSILLDLLKSRTVPGQASSRCQYCGNDASLRCAIPSDTQYNRLRQICAWHQCSSFNVGRERRGFTSRLL